MGDVKTNRITGISDSETSIPVYWTLAANDIYYNNAIIMGVTIARRIDKANLWDGLLHFKERFNKIKVNPWNIGMTNIVEAVVSYQPVEPISLKFVENVSGWKVNPWDIKHKSFDVELLKESCSAINKGDDRIIITFSNPVYSTDYAALITAFNIININGTTVTMPNIKSVEQSGVNEIALIFALGTLTGGIVSIGYISTFGDICACSDNSKVSDFTVVFDVTPVQTTNLIIESEE